MSDEKLTGNAKRLAILEHSIAAAREKRDEHMQKSLYHAAETDRLNLLILLMVAKQEQLKAEIAAGEP